MKLGKYFGCKKNGAERKKKKEVIPRRKDHENTTRKFTTHGTPVNVVMEVCLQTALYKKHKDANLKSHYPLKTIL